MKRWLIVLATLAALAPVTTAQAPPPDLSGVYQVVSSGTVLGGGLRNTGSPNDIALLPAATAQMKAVDLKEDPLKLCQPLGSFRMMAREGTKFELVPARGLLVMIFEDLAHGLMRTIHLNRPHQKMEPNWLGDSVGRWETGTLVIDTVGFNDRTWLNDAGAPHSDVLHLIERLKPIQSGKYLEYSITAEDPKVLAKSYSYTRYLEKVDTDIKEDVCEYQRSLGTLLR